MLKFEFYRLYSTFAVGFAILSILSLLDGKVALFWIDILFSSYYLYRWDNIENNKNE